MGCSFDKNILSRFARGKIEPLEKVFMEEHIKKCSECRSYLENERIIAKSEKKNFRKIASEEEIEDVKKDAVFKGSEKSSKATTSMGIASIAISGATSWLRVIPFKEIAKNIFKGSKSSS